ncbi:MAG: hypothetical protein IGR76_10420 [Synechococcales cyanobacterium T60_A2020_003]|nr:hypothetical protein [Synechococcales cyanobacterium T60_A2020_003]
MRDEGLRQSELWPGWLNENARRESAFQDWRDRSGEGEARSAALAQDSQQQLMLQRLDYQDWLAQQQREEPILNGAWGQGLNRNDFYNIEKNGLQNAMSCPTG